MGRGRLFIKRGIVVGGFVFAIYVFLKFVDLGPWAMAAIYFAGGGAIFLLVKSFLFKH